MRPFWGTSIRDQEFKMPIGLNGNSSFTSAQFPSPRLDGNVQRFYTFASAFTERTTASNTFTEVYSGSTGVSGVAMKGIIQAGNGFVYVFPGNGGQVLKFDPKTEAAMERPAGLTNMMQTSQGASIHLDDSGRYIYIFSTQETQSRGIRRIDTQTDTVTTISGTNSASRMFGVKAPNGHIYFCPYYANSANSFTKFNMDTETFSTFGTALVPNVFGWNNTLAFGVALDGKMYAMMRDKIVVVDPMTDSITWDSGLGLGLSSSGKNAYTSSPAVLAPNGCFYVPSNNTGITSSVLKVNPAGSSGLTFSFIPYTTTINRQRGTIGADGYLYFTTQYTGINTNVMRIDWRTDAISEFGSGRVNRCCDHASDMTLASNGSIYVSVYDQGGFLQKINTGVSRSIPEGFHLSRYVKNSGNASKSG